MKVPVLAVRTGFTHANIINISTPHTKQRDSYKFPLFISKRGKQMTIIKNRIKLNSAVRAYWILIF